MVVLPLDCIAPVERKSLAMPRYSPLGEFRHKLFLQKEEFSVEVLDAFGRGFYAGFDVKGAGRDAPLVLVTFRSCWVRGKTSYRVNRFEIRVAWKSPLSSYWPMLITRSPSFT